MNHIVVYDKSDTSWQDLAACVGLAYRKYFYSLEEYEQELAKQICQGCAVKPECLTYAIRNHEYGVWGGTTEKERRRIIRLKLW